MSLFDHLAAFWRTGWDVHPDRSVLLIAIGLGYAVGVIALRRAGRRVVWFQGALFLLGLGALALAIHSPLHHLSDRYLFSAHMVQHQLITLVVPPLLLLGIPNWLVLHVPRALWLAPFGRTALFPVMAFAVFNLLFAFVHFPSIYDALFGDELLHFLTHGALLVTGLLTWIPLFSPIPDLLPRLSLPGQMLYCFAQAIPGSLVGSLITLADRLIYRHYGVRPLELGIDPLADQQVGGLLMWVGAGSFFLVILTVLFFIWADREEVKAYR